uniref:Uncharacterized protein n=1 Tax=Paramormyrops kingsleyae TaxID=1676925 RepID=A0A3B3T5B7_9TELE
LLAPVVKLSLEECRGQGWGDRGQGGRWKRRPQAAWPYRAFPKKGRGDGSLYNMPLPHPPAPMDADEPPPPAPAPRLRHYSQYFCQCLQPVSSAGGHAGPPLIYSLPKAPYTTPPCR